MSRPECFSHCPMIYDRAEEGARAIKAGVSRGDSGAKEPFEAVIAACAAAAASECEGPERQEVPKPRESLLGRLGIVNTPGSTGAYVCGRTSDESEVPRYLFKDV